jgi:hypothetical protein
LVCFPSRFIFAVTLILGGAQRAVNFRQREPGPGRRPVPLSPQTGHAV